MTTYQQTNRTMQKDNGPRKKLQPIKKLSLSQIHTHPSILQQAVQNPHAARPEMILQLQQIYGNRAMEQMITAANKRNVQVPSCAETLSQTTPTAIASEQEAKQAQGQGMSSDLVIQRAIDKESLGMALYDGIPLQPPEPTNVTMKKLRDYKETEMLLEELHLRYPGVQPPEALVTRVVGILKQNRINTFPIIRQAIIDAEKAQDPMAIPAPMPSLPEITNMDKFIKSLTERRGAYFWASGTSKAFVNWISGGIPLREDAQINCWEAILFSAAQANLVTIEQLQDVYRDPVKRTAAIYQLISRRGKTVIQHPGPGPNNIKVGDVIMLNGSDLSHVMVALEAETSNYLNVIVMSLWERVGGGSFTKTKLEEVIPYSYEPEKKTNIEYSTL